MLGPRWKIHSELLIDAPVKHHENPLNLLLTTKGYLTYHFGIALNLGADLPLLMRTGRRKHPDQLGFQRQIQSTSHPQAPGLRFLKL
jgi:hypothetical protein